MALHKLGKLEALLFASGQPLPLEKMAGALALTQAQTADLLEELQHGYQEADRGLTLRKAAGGWQLVTKEEAAPVLQILYEQQEQKLSTAAMETLAIVAFKQPVTKSEMEAIRGVKVDGVLNTLTDLGLITEVGRKEVIGKPILYGTTDRFLTTFGFNTLADLPDIPDEILEQKLFPEEGEEVLELESSEDAPEENEHPAGEEPQQKA